MGPKDEEAARARATDMATHADVAQLKACLDLLDEFAKVLLPPPTSGMTLAEFNEQISKLRSDVKRQAVIEKFKQSQYYTYRNAVHKLNACLEELQQDESIFSLSIQLQVDHAPVVVFSMNDSTGLPPIVFRTSVQEARNNILTRLKNHLENHVQHVNEVRIRVLMISSDPDSSAQSVPDQMMTYLLEKD